MTITRCSYTEIINNKMPRASDDTKTKQIYSYFTRKDMRPILNATGLHSTKEEQKGPKFRQVYIFEYNKILSN